MKIVIIGNGISGITAARHIRKRSQHEILVISKESDYFFSRTALMYIYMGHMRYKDTKPYEDWFWDKNRIGLLRAEVTAIDFDQKQLTTNTNSDNESPGETVAYDVLIIATGSNSNKFGWPGQDLDHVHGLYSLQDLEALENRSPHIEHGVIVGGGLVGIELAEMLHTRGKSVTLLVREENYWDNVLPREEAQMVNEQIRRLEIDLRLNTELKEILGDDQNKVRAVTTHAGEEIKCQFVGLTAGVHPNIRWMGTNTPIECNRGILVDEYLQTNIPDVYAIGDCAELKNPPPGRDAVEPVWYVGRIMGETVAHTITGRPTPYRPGPWFNSAKFINLEYQVYGEVPNKIEAPYASFFWRHKDKDIALRLVYKEEDRIIAGVNVMGLRFRQHVCERWIKNKYTIEDAMNELNDAHFDPELFRRHYKEIKESFHNTVNIATP